MTDDDDELEITLKEPIREEFHPLGVFEATDEMKRKMYCVEFVTMDWGMRGKEALINAQMYLEYLEDGKVPTISDEPSVARGKFKSVPKGDTL